MPPKKIFSILMVATAALLGANPAHACAMCFGKTDSPLAVAMNWGIFSLLAVVVFVLGTIASFAIYLARKAASAPPPPMPKDSIPDSLPLPETNKA